jgi:hypothetical protein
VELVPEEEAVQTEQPAAKLEGSRKPLAGATIIDPTAQGPWTTAPIWVGVITEAGIMVVGTADGSVGSHVEDLTPTKYWPNKRGLLQVNDWSVDYKAERLNS